MVSLEAEAYFNLSEYRNRTNPGGLGPIKAQERIMPIPVSDVTHSYWLVTQHSCSK